MNFKQHRNYGLTISLLASIGYCLFYTGLYLYQSGSLVFSWKLLEYCLGLFVICFAGSLAPDLDTDSIPSKWVARILAVYLGIVLFSKQITDSIGIDYELKWKPVASLIFIFLIAKIGKHRGISHALFWVPLLMIMSLRTGNHFIGAFAVGLGVHYYCDSINPWRLKNWL
jgi:hypothetical protein